MLNAYLNYLEMSCLYLNLAELTNSQDSMEMIKNIPVHMDYVGQGRAEKLYQIIIVLFGVVGLGWGYTIQQFSQTVRKCNIYMDTRKGRSLTGATFLALT
jgi:hypothetical protein